jgi:hypothetical protein
MEYRRPSLWRSCRRTSRRRTGLPLPRWRTGASDCLRKPGAQHRRQCVRQALDQGPARVPAAAIVGIRERLDSRPARRRPLEDSGGSCAVWHRRRESPSDPRGPSPHRWSAPRPQPRRNALRQHQEHRLADLCPDTIDQAHQSRARGAGKRRHRLRPVLRLLGRTGLDHDHVSPNYRNLFKRSDRCTARAHGTS